MRTHLLIALITLQVGSGSICRGEGIPKYTPQAVKGSQPSCEPLIETCNELVELQDTEIATLKKYNRDLANKIADEQKEPLISSPTWLLLGVVLGGIVGYKLH